MATKDPTHLAWIDLETTGLHLENDYIIEFALMVTDLQLNQQHIPYCTPVSQGLGWLTMLERNEFVDTMHQKNGLKDELMRGHGIRYAEVDEMASSLLDRYGKPGDFMIAGSGVASFDLPRVQKWLPKTAAYLQYRALDVGQMRRFFQYVMQRPDLITESEEHRALPDMMDAWSTATRFKYMFDKMLERK